MVPFARIRLRLYSSMVPIVRLTRPLLLASAFIAWSSTAQAAPITLAFEATIDTVFPGIPFNTGIEFAPGDMVKGRFTFDPVPGDGGMFLEADQPHEFSLDINGILLATPGFQIESVNDSPISDFPPAHVIDSILVQCGNSPNGCAPGVRALSGGDPFRLGIRMSLFADAGVINQAEVPADILTWNGFALERQLVVNFVNLNGGGMAFQAIVGPFSVVPEPATLVLAVIALFVIQLRTRITIYS